MAVPTFAIPGQTLTTSSKHSPGPGTHLTNSTITSSLLGPTVTKKNTTTPKSAPILSISRPPTTPLQPSVNAQVYARITRLERQQARCDILTVTDTVCPIPHRGILRSQDVRATEKDKVKLADCFVVGDIIRAVIVGLGDQTGYYLSTAGNDFGVVMAWSEKGNVCVPISWMEVRDQVTGEKELRKVARPV
jgi:exosome complex component CSL4